MGTIVLNMTEDEDNLILNEEPRAGTGCDGVGIESIEQTLESVVDNGINVMTIKTTDGKESVFYVRNGSKGNKGDRGIKGEKGEAFTYEDFTPEQLAGLKGEPGDPGDKGDPFKFEDFTPDQLESLKGEKGDEGEQGPRGEAFTYEDFTPEQLAGLKGEPGYTPQKGVDYFDGQPGKDGVSATHLWNGTVLTVTSASGTSSADLKGEKGDRGVEGQPGKDGYTPQKGVDYWTDTDKQEMINALPKPSWDDITGKPEDKTEDIYAELAKRPIAYETVVETPLVSMFMPDEGAAVITEAFSLEVGKEYTLVVNGTEHTGTAVETEIEGIPVVAMLGETFMFMRVPDGIVPQAGCYGMFAFYEPMTECVLSLKYEELKTIPQKLLGLEWLPTEEKEVEIASFVKTDLFGTEELNLEMLEGCYNIKVKFNGVWYEPSIIAVPDGAEPVMCIGNMSLFVGTEDDFPDTGEPFLLYVTPLATVINTVDGTGSFEVVATKKMPNPMPEKFLPETVATKAHVEQLIGGIENGTY